MSFVTTDISLAARYLLNDNLVAIPTETVYGLAGNALKEHVVARIFEIKNRPFFNPLIVHIAGTEQLIKYAEKISDVQGILAERFWPGPLTILFKKKNIIPDIVTAGLSRVGIRCPAHPLTLALLKELDFPLAAPSANPFGYVSPTTADHVQKHLGSKIPCILDGGPCRVGLESTVVEAIGNQIRILRPGAITADDIRKAGNFEIIISDFSSSRPSSPGQLEKHYAPKASLFLLPRTEWNQFFHELSVTVIYWGKPDPRWPAQWIKLSLSEKENLVEAASRLFSLLRWADEHAVKTVLAEPVPALGMGIAINDRLKRAAAR